MKNYALFTFSLLIIFSNILFAKIDLDFSHKRGYYNSSFQLTIIAEDPTAVIKYTTNDQKPSTTNGNTYTGPITINTTTTVKVFAYSATEVSNVRAHSYLFLSDIISSPEMYTYITQDTLYGPQMETSLQSLPVLSISSDLINGTDHIYSEIETSAELFFPDNSRDGFMINCGIQTWGGSPSNPKKHYRLEFKSIYGETKLKYKLFKEDNYDDTKYKIPPTDEFDKLLLRAGSQDALNSEYGHELYPLFVRNRVLMDVQMEMGFPTPHGRFVHVFINGSYSGQYHFMERPDANWFASYYGQDESQYEVYKSGIYWDNDNAIWDNLASNVDLSSSASIAATRDHIDLEQAAAYLNIMAYASGFDWSEDHNCLGGGNISPGNGGYKFIVWDLDFSLGNGGHWSPSYAYNPYYFEAPQTDDGPVPDNLVGNVEFNYMMDDNLECSCYNNGILTANKMDSIFNRRINQITTSLIAESARWGGYNFDFTNGHVDANSWDVNDEFMTELNRITGTYIPTRSGSIITHYENNNFSSDLDGVEFSKYGGLVPANYTLTLTNTNSNSSIYYTLDGSDPRAVGGGIASGAILYSSPINLNAGTVTIKARVRDNNHSNNSINKWSAMCPRQFYVGQNYSGLTINEIHYNPNDSITLLNDTISGRKFEFIELKNTGTSEIFLDNVSFSKGVTLTFNDLVIQPDSFLIIAEDEFWFEEKYGFAPDATYIGKLSNSGERIQIDDPVGNFIDSLNYSDSYPWDTIPDQGYYSIAYISGSTDNTDPANWSAQNVFTTPRAENEHCPGEILNSLTINSPSCLGGDGSIITNVSGGDGGPYIYSWNDGSSDGFNISLTDGTYIVEISDNSKCYRSDTIVLLNDPQISNQQNVSDQYYYNSPDGSASVINIMGGQSPYSFLWSNGEETGTIENLLPGTYTVEISDINGCTANDTMIVEALDCSLLDLSVNTTNESSFGANDGIAYAAVNGAYMPITYNWDTGDTTSFINNLMPGFYELSIVDNRGCEASGMFEILQYGCDSFSMQINTVDQSFYQQNNGSANITINNGLAPYTIFWNTGETTIGIDDLAPGNYSVNVTGADNCQLIENITINAVDCNNLYASPILNHETCFGNADGSISLNITGGNFPYSVNWDHGPNSQNISNLTAGTYSYYLTDNFGCPFSDTIIVNGPQSDINLSAAVTNESFLNAGDGAIDITVTGGVAPYNYFWATGSNDEDIGSLVSGSYWVIVSDENGCNATESYIVNEAQNNNCDSVSNVSLINPSANGITIFWNTVPGAINYEIQYKESGEINWTSTNSVTNLQVLNNLNSCTDYELQIITNCSNSYSSAASAVYYFSTTDCGSVCEDVTNLSDNNETEQSVILQWDLISNANYTLYTRESGDVDWNENFISFPFAILFNLTPCTTFEWKVVVHCENGNISDGSVIQQFSTLCPSPRIENTDKPLISEKSNIKLYPNPVENLLNIVVDNRKIIEIVNIFNATGAKVYSLNNYENLSSFQISTVSFENGIFWLDVRYADGSYEVAQFVKKY